MSEVPSSQDRIPEQVSSDAPDAPATPRHTLGGVLGRVAIVAVLGAFALALIVGPTERWIRDLVALVGRFEGASGMGMYVVLYTIGALGAFPASIMTVVGGFLFGPLWGTAVVVVATVVGSTATLVTSRYVARDFVQRRIAGYPRFLALERAIERESFKAVLLVRLVPFIPYALLNYGLGLTSVRWRPYIVATVLGKMPTSVALIYVGAAAGSLTQALASPEPPDTVHLGLYLFGGIAITLGVWWMAHRARRELESMIDGG